ncbi:MAG: hypothetical protein AAGJ40_19210 [Planctomycetota bacterium]
MRIMPPAFLTGRMRSLSWCWPLLVLLTSATGCTSVLRGVRHVEKVRDASILAKSVGKDPIAELAGSTAPEPLQRFDSDDMVLAIALETARLAEQRGMDGDAIRAYQQVRRLDPSKPDVSHKLAVLYDRSSMTDAASREYATALKETPEDADVLCDYGYFLYSTGHLQQAESKLRQGLTFVPNHQRCSVNLAVVLGEQKQYEEARRLFERAIGPAAAQHNIGMIKLRHGDTLEGARLVAEASRKDPSIRQSLPNLDHIASTTFVPDSPVGSGSLRQVKYETQAHQP